MYDNTLFPSSCKSLCDKMAYCALCAASTMATSFIMFWFIGMC